MDVSFEARYMSLEAPCRVHCGGFNTGVLQPFVFPLVGAPSRMLRVISDVSQRRKAGCVTLKVCHVKSVKVTTDKFSLSTVTWTYEYVLHQVQYEGGRKLQRRLKGLVKDPAKHSVIFYNEFQKYCYHPRQPGDVLVEWQTKYVSQFGVSVRVYRFAVVNMKICETFCFHPRNVYDGAAWYYNHLAGQIPIVFVTTDPKVPTKDTH